MASNKKFTFGPQALTTTTTVNQLNPGTTAGGVLNGGNFTSGNYTNLQITLTHIRVVNKTNAAIFVALWKGATGANAAGTEAIWGGAATAGALNANTGVAVPANGTLDWNGALLLVPADFLVGGASAAGCTIEGEGEIGVL